LTNYQDQADSIRELNNVKDWPSEFNDFGDNGRLENKTFWMAAP
jgi:hypothetical protein